MKILDPDPRESPLSLEYVSRAGKQKKCTAYPEQAFAGTLGDGEEGKASREKVGEGGGEGGNGTDELQP